MAKRSKRYQKAAARIDRARRYPLDEAVRTLVAAEGAAKFDETVELAVKLGVDPRQADQNVRGTVVLPHGRGKAVRVVVFAKGEKAKEASEAGAAAGGRAESDMTSSDGDGAGAASPRRTPATRWGAR